MIKATIAIIDLVIVLILSFFIFRGFRNGLVKELMRVTRPGGWILIEFCNKWRLKRFKESSVRLSMYQVISQIKKEASVSQINKRGILIFSETLLNRTPSKLLFLFKWVDYVFSSIFPYFAARCYLSVHLSE